MARIGSTVNTNVCVSFPRSVAMADRLIVLVFKNGKSGFLGEHSCMDETRTMRLNRFALAARIDLGPPRTPETGKGLPPPTKLKFVVDEPVTKHVKDAEIATRGQLRRECSQIIGFRPQRCLLLTEMQAPPLDRAVDMGLVRSARNQRFPARFQDYIPSLPGASISRPKATGGGGKGKSERGRAGAAA